MQAPISSTEPSSSVSFGPLAAAKSIIPPILSGRVPIGRLIKNGLKTGQDKN
jgi:hypothetical protein